jgi:hypothetical protein
MAAADIDYCCLVADFQPHIITLKALAGSTGKTAVCPR